MISFVLANIGQGPARYVEFTFHADENDFTSHNVQLSNRSDRKAISTLPQGERVVAFFGAGHELYTEPRLAPFRVEVRYEDLLRRSYIGDFELDVSQFAGLIHLGSPPEQEVAEAMKKLARKVGEWTSGSRRLKVEVITAEQFRRHQQEVRRASQEHVEGRRSPSDHTA